MIPQPKNNISPPSWGSGLVGLKLPSLKKEDTLSRRQDVPPLIAPSKCSFPLWVEPNDAKRETPKRAVPPTRNEETSETDSFLDAEIYFDLSKHKDGDYVSRRMREVSEIVSLVGKSIEVRLSPLPGIDEEVSEETFGEILGIYENNQEYYKSAIECDKISPKVASEKLTELERWFLLAMESLDQDAQRIARDFLKANGNADFFCDPSLEKYINRQSLESGQVYDPGFDDTQPIE